MAPPMVTLQAPAGTFPGTYLGADGNAYAVSSIGLVTIPASIQLPALAAGFTVPANPQLYTAVATNTPATLTPAQLAGAMDVAVNMTAVLAGAGTLTLPTIAALLAALPNLGVGDTLRLRIINSSGGAFAWTVTTAAGWTLLGTMSIAQNTWRDFYVTITSVVNATATLQEIGTGTQS